MQIEVLPRDRTDDAVALWQVCGLTRPWNDPVADVARALAGSSSTVLGAYDADGRLLGTAMVGHDGHRGWIYYLAVQPERQGEGVGTRLVQASEHWLRDRGLPKVNLMVRTTNSAVVGFYESLGYDRAETVVLGRSLTARALPGSP